MYFLKEFNFKETLTWAFNEGIGRIDFRKEFDFSSFFFSIPCKWDFEFEMVMMLLKLTGLIWVLSFLSNWFTFVSSLAFFLKEELESEDEEESDDSVDGERTLLLFDWTFQKFTF